MLSLIKASTTANIALPPAALIQCAADSIQAIDEAANLRIEEGTLTWSSDSLLESVAIDFLEMNDTTCVWAAHLECDAPIVAAAFNHLQASLHAEAGAEEEAASILEATERLLTDATFNEFVEVTKSALKGAADSPYRSVKRYTEVMSKLPALAQRRQPRHACRGMRPRRCLPRRHQLAGKNQIQDGTRIPSRWPTHALKIPRNTFGGCWVQ